jgi:hypothetical protein
MEDFSGGEPCDVVQPADESDDDSSNPNDKKEYYEVGMAMETNPFT